MQELTEERVNAAIAKVGTLGQFCELAGMSYSTIYAWKRNHDRVSVETVRKLTAAVDSVLGDTEVPRAVAVSAKRIERKTDTNLVAMLKLLEQNVETLSEETDDDDVVETLVAKVLPELVGILPKLIKQGKKVQAYKAGVRTLRHMAEKE